jgi:hypothetical protein
VARIACNARNPSYGSTHALCTVIFVTEGFGNAEVKVNVEGTIAKMLSVFIFFVLFNPSVSFNIDVNLPVVRQNDQIGSYFGFSVAQHQWFNRTKGANENW